MSREIELSSIKKKSVKTKVVKKEAVSVKKPVLKAKPKKKAKPESIKKSIPTKKELKKIEGSGLETIGTKTIEIMQSTVFDKNREQADQYELMFYKLVTIKNIAENKYLESKQSKDIYALMKVYDQMREVIADMKSLQDVGDYIFSIDEEVLRPLLTQSGQALLELVRNVVQFGSKNLSETDSMALSAYIKKQGKAAGFHLQDAYRSSMDNTRKILVG